jgi:very-long-chain (3R)-3-hydroxyacyl-CoA dehydratase
MAPKSRQPQPAKPRSGPKGLNKIYLLAYNLVSGVLWFSVLSRVLTIGKLEGNFESGRVYDETEQFARLVQTGAVLEVLHSLLGASLYHIPHPSSSLLHSIPHTAN